LADYRTKRILKRRRTAKRWGTVAAGAIIGAVLEWAFAWQPVAFVLGKFQDLQDLGLEAFLPQSGTWLYHLLELSSAPVAGILLVLPILPLSKAVLDRLFPDPPPFLRTDFATECTQTITLQEAPPPAFVGREAEREALVSFAAQSKPPFLWRAMIGPTGVGKSRLAIEWLQNLRDAGWDAGVAAPDSPVPDDWRARRPTAIVIDDAGRQWAIALGPTLERLASAARPKAPVRVLIVDVVEPNTDSIAVGPQRATVRAARADAPLVLFGLGEAAFKVLWMRAGGRSTATDEELTSLYQETAGRPRALLLLTRAAPGTSMGRPSPTGRWRCCRNWPMRPGQRGRLPTVSG
jgi:hypothetical protein